MKESVSLLLSVQEPSQGVVAYFVYGSGSQSNLGTLGNKLMHGLFLSKRPTGVLGLCLCVTRIYYSTHLLWHFFRRTKLA